MAIGVHCVAVVLTVVGCGSTPTSTDPLGPETAAPSSRPAGEVTFLEAWQARLPELMAKASAFERGLIGDGIVTDAEHELAIISYLDCIRRAGLRVVEFERGPSGMITLLGVDEPDTPPGVESPVLRCQAEFYTYAREGYHATTVDPNGSEQAVLRALAACLRERGIYEVPEDPGSAAEISGIIGAIDFDDHTNERGARDAWTACQTEVMG